MKHWWNKLRHIVRHRSWTINRYLHPTAQLCRRTVITLPFAIGPDSRVRNSYIGRHTYITRRVLVDTARIGNYCSIGPECIIGGLGLHPTGYFSTSPLTYSARHPITDLLGRTGVDLDLREQAEVVIEADVWIGARAVICDGAKIGVGAIIGANTFVSGEVPPYAVYYGSPPRIQRYRFPPEIIAQLLATQWWLKAPEELDPRALEKIIAWEHTNPSRAKQD